MNYPELNEIIHRHQRAWLLLRDAQRHGRVASHRLDASLIAVLSDAAAARDWFSRHRDQLPVQLRPSIPQIETFARLIASFFATSVRLTSVRDRTGEMRSRLVSSPSQNLQGSRRGTRSKQRLAEKVRTLRFYGFESLLQDGDIAIEGPPALFDKLDAEADFARDVTLYTYAVELLRRGRFASQGEAVHRLWLTLSEDDRTHLSADLIWAARARLIVRLGAIPELRGIDFGDGLVAAEEPRTNAELHDQGAAVHSSSPSTLDL